MNGLKSLGKSNSGDLEFKTTAASAPKKSLSSPKVAVKARGRTATTSKAAEKVADDVENISPKPAKNTRKRNTSNDPQDTNFSPSKKVRSTSSHKSSAASKLTQLTSKASPADSSIVVHNHANQDKIKKTKTYNLNFELDISFDANVVVNVKRKSKKKSKQEPPATANDSIKSTDEIPATEKSFFVTTTRVSKRGTRTSPRK